MKKCTTFQCLLKLVGKKMFAESVKQYDADRYSKTFKSWQHFAVMLYAQLNGLSSLRDIKVGFDSQKLLHPAAKTRSISRSTLSDANERRPAEFFLWIAQQLMRLLPRKPCKEMGKVLSILDSSPIRLAGRGYDEWTMAHKTMKGQGLKLHMEYDPETALPVKMVTSYPNCNDCTIGQAWLIKPEHIYIFDKGYCDFNWWWSITQKEAFFVTRLKSNTAFQVIRRHKPLSALILEDSTIRLTNKSPRGGKKNLYVKELRRVVVAREGHGSPLVLVTNLFNISAEQIAKCYKIRWKIELFFKWIKQNLKIKKYLGRSENAVRIQLAVGIIAYLLTAIFKLGQKSNLSLRHTLIWIKQNLTREVRFRFGVPPPDKLAAKGAQL
jgi:putative transposase